MIGGSETSKAPMAGLRAGVPRVEAFSGSLRWSLICPGSPPTLPDIPVVPPRAPSVLNENVPKRIPASPQEVAANVFLSMTEDRAGRRLGPADQRARCRRPGHVLRLPRALRLGVNPGGDLAVL